MPEEFRVDVQLVRRGLARSRHQAAELVEAGRVIVDGRVVRKPSARVPSSGLLRVDGDTGAPPYASRAAHKLVGALEALGDRVTVSGADCADLGASTGGFTDVLLRRGAAHVTAVDVGHGQLRDELRSDPRVRVIEGLNVRDLTAETLTRPPALVVGDLSFISLTLVVGPVSRAVPAEAHLLLLVKPQFEVGRGRLGSGGVVRDPDLHAEALQAVVEAAAVHGRHVHAVVPSPLPGPSGNREFFVWLRSTPSEGDVAGWIADAVSGRPSTGGDTRGDR